MPPHGTLRACAELGKGVGGRWPRPQPAARGEGAGTPHPAQHVRAARLSPSTASSCGRNCPLPAPAAPGRPGSPPRSPVSEHQARGLGSDVPFAGCRVPGQRQRSEMAALRPSCRSCTPSSTLHRELRGRAHSPLAGGGWFSPAPAWPGSQLTPRGKRHSRFRSPRVPLACSRTPCVLSSGPPVSSSRAWSWTRPGSASPGFVPPARPQPRASPGHQWTQ